MTTSRLHMHSQLQQVLVGILLALLTTSVVLGQASATEVRELKFGKKLEREIKRGELHEFKLALRSQQVLIVELEEQSFDVKIGLIKASDNRSVATADVGGGFDRENLVFVAEESGDYLLRIDAAENQFGSGSYRFSARLADELAEKDKTRVEALRLLSDAVAVQKENTAVKIREAIAKREQALTLWRTIGDKYWEGRTLDRLGTAHNALLENNKAVDYLDRALQIIKASDDNLLEAATLNTIGSMTNGFGEYQQAIEYHNEALQIFQKVKNSIGIMNSLNFLGNANVGLKDYPKANEYYQKSLTLAQKGGNTNSEAYSLYLLGTVLDVQNEKPKAAERYHQSLALWREIKNVGGVALALLKIGQIQTLKGATDEALKNFNEALKLFQAEKNRNQEAVTYFALSSIYYSAGNIAEAIEAYQKSLAFYQEFKLRFFEIVMTGTLANFYESLPDVKEAIKYAEAALAIEETVPERYSETSVKIFKDGMKNSKAMSLQTLGSIHFNSGDTDKALQYNAHALSMFEKQGDANSKRRTSISLLSIAQVHQYRYEWDKALETYDRALSIANELNDKFQRIMTLNSMGLIYSNTGNKKKALELYTKVLDEVRLLPNKGDQEKIFEAAIINNIGISNLFLGEARKALDFHNQALTIQLEIKDLNYIDNQANTYVSLAGVHAFLGKNARAIDLLNKALELYRQAPQRVKDLARNRTTEATILNNLGVRYKETGSFRKALEYYKQALQLALDSKRADMEATVLNNIALVHQAFGEPRKALQNFNKALDINHRHQDIEGEATILNNIGQVYSDLGDKKEAIKYTNQALEIAEKIGNKETITSYLNNLGNTYATLSENVKALDYFNRALAISVETGNKTGELLSINNLAVLYSNTGERGKSLDNYEKALSIVRSIGDRAGEASILGNMAFDYLELGENQTALAYREKSLEVSREIGDKSGETYQLNGIGAIYYKLGEKSKDPQHSKLALTNFEQALKLSRETESKSNEADALLGIGKIYTELSDTARALPALTQAMDYSMQYKSRFFEDAVHLALGKLHEKNGAFDKAIEEYQQSLLVARAITDKDIESKALKGMMSAWNARGNVKLAVFYGKQAVNKYQELRGSIRNLKRETQNVYRDKVTDIYRELADLLIAIGHLREAEQVLAMLKEQEAFDFVRRDAGEAEDLLSKKVGLDQRQQKALAEYVRLSDELTAKSQRLDVLELKSDLSQPEKDEQQKLKKAVEDATEGILVFFKKLESEFTKKTEDSGTITAESIDVLRRELQPGEVLISTYLLPKRYRVIVSTGRTMVDRKTEYQPLNLDGEQVNRKIMEFKRVLQNPRLDPRSLGKELYDIFVKPIEKDIVNAKTLLWSLDGSLRYIPVGALYDGKQYLAERYQNVFVTLGRTSKLFDEPTRRDWRVLGLGVSKQYENFSELPAVPFELRTIVRDERGSQDNEGVLSGIRLLDSEFTEQSFIDNLRPAKNFNVVHLATHFRLGSNLDNSGLLLGDGKVLSLYTINKQDSDFDFKNIELLTLSACQTGVTVGDSNGGEVESLGMIAQKNGAKAILSTLWKVADRSTAILMSEFYRLRKENPRLTKSEALQIAQKEMMAGELGPKIVTGEQRDTGEIIDSLTTAPRYTVDPEKPYAHPYYWAPFILIGNWR